MPGIGKEQVLARLRTVSHPAVGGDIVARGMVSDIFIADNKVFFSITVPADAADGLEPLRREAEQAVAALEGVERAVVALTAEKRPEAPSRPVSPAAPPGSRPTAKAGVPGVAAVIAVASGKGGVGKSTTAVNLALGLRAIGLGVGVLDADVYGPSIPRLLGIKGPPEASGARALEPKRAFGLAVMSMGFLVAEETPMVWRGPMVVSALTQMLREVAWGALDVLVVDMPPGTGDAQLTLAQRVPLAGAVIVSTPQDLALIDARKGLNMFRKVDVPLLGLIENMSYFLCPSCGGRADIFGHGGARGEAARLGVPFLGEVPLHMAIREHCDAGTPVVAADPDGPHARVFREIAVKVREALGERAGERQTAAPRIVFE